MSDSSEKAQKDGKHRPSVEGGAKGQPRALPEMQSAVSRHMTTDAAPKAYLGASPPLASEVHLNGLGIAGGFETAPRRNILRRGLRKIVGRREW